MLERGRSFFIPASAWLFELLSHNILNTVDAVVGATDYCLYACQRFLTRRPEHAMQSVSDDHP